MPDPLEILGKNPALTPDSAELSPALESAIANQLASKTFDDVEAVNEVVAADGIEVTDMSQHDDDSRLLLATHEGKGGQKSQAFLNAKRT